MMTKESRHLLSCDATILNTWLLKSSWKRKSERMITSVLLPVLEVMYIISAHVSEPSHLGSTRLQEPLEHVVVLCAQEEEMRL